MSVSVLTIESLEVVLKNVKPPVVTAIRADYCRELDLEIVPDPLEDDPGHCLVIVNRKTGKAKKLRDAAIETAINVNPGSSAEDVYRALRARCDDYDRAEGTER